jgi:hypothetical protein
VYHFLNVEQPGERVIETMGLPLTVIGNVAKETPEQMDDELSKFVYSMATQEQWETRYVCGNFNSIKWVGINTSVVEETGYYQMLKLMMKCFMVSPRASFKALFSLTDIVYGINTGLEGDVVPEITGNDYGIAYAGNQWIRTLLQDYSSLVNHSFLKYLRTYGVVIATIIVCIVGKINWKSWKRWKKLFLVLPIFFYDFGTMLLLTGEDSRFFYITFLLCPLLILFTLYEKKENGDVQ